MERKRKKKKRKKNRKERKKNCAKFLTLDRYNKVSLSWNGDLQKKSARVSVWPCDLWATLEPCLSDVLRLITALWAKCHSLPKFIYNSGAWLIKKKVTCRLPELVSIFGCCRRLHFPHIALQCDTAKSRADDSELVHMASLMAGRKKRR